MLTNEQLAEFAHHAEMSMCDDDECDTCDYLRDALRHIAQLSAHNSVMSAALAQLSDAENWAIAPSVQYVVSGAWPSPLDQPVYMWRVASNPIELAERALVGNAKE